MAGWALRDSQVSSLSLHCLLWVGKGLLRPFPCRGELTAPPEKQPSPLQSAPHIRSPPGPPPGYSRGQPGLPRAPSELSAQFLLLSRFLHKEVGEKANRQVSTPHPGLGAGSKHTKEARTPARGGRAVPASQGQGHSPLPHQDAAPVLVTSGGVEPTRPGWGVYFRLPQPPGLYFLGAEAGHALLASRPVCNRGSSYPPPRIRPPITSPSLPHR